MAIARLASLGWQEVCDINPGGLLNLDIELDQILIMKYHVYVTCIYDIN